MGKGDVTLSTLSVFTYNLWLIDGHANLKSKQTNKQARNIYCSYSFLGVQPKLRLHVLSVLFYVHCHANQHFALC